MSEVPIFLVMKWDGREIAIPLFPLDFERWHVLILEDSEGESATYVVSTYN